MGFGAWAWLTPRALAGLSPRTACLFFTLHTRSFSLRLLPPAPLALCILLPLSDYFLEVPHRCSLSLFDKHIYNHISIFSRSLCTSFLFVSSPRIAWQDPNIFFEKLTRILNTRFFSASLPSAFTQSGFRARIETNDRA
ncbi:hypothetical protein BX600DRAFT_282184 [Xylariales sp. PMI_506]|nr:hypothetical protein BX600DRAFT_282184 [Xylariales sp. PMI_506]